MQPRFLLPQNLRLETSAPAGQWPVDFCLKAGFAGEQLLESSVFFDYAAGTPLIQDAYHEMIPWLFGYCGNSAATVHSMGKLAFFALEEARDRFCKILALKNRHIIFTSSATESNNLLLRGLVMSRFRKRKKVLYSPTEHASVIETIERLKFLFGSSGEITAESLIVDRTGQIDLADAEQKLTPDTLCLCVMDVNNETGIVQNNLAPLIELASKNSIWVHIDAVQGFGRGSFFSKKCAWDSLTLSSAKIYGPRGAALLALKNSSRFIESQLTGGKHEQGLRASTPNIAAIVGFAKACELQEEERETRNAHYLHLEARFKALLCEHFPSAFIIAEDSRAPGIMSVCFPSVNTLKMLGDVKRLCVGVGSACSSGKEGISHVQKALNISPENSMSILRFSFGLPNSDQEIEYAAQLLKKYMV